MVTIGQIQPIERNQINQRVGIRNLEDGTSHYFDVLGNPVKNNTYRFLSANEADVIIVDNWSFPCESISVESGDGNKGYIFFSAIINNNHHNYCVEIDLPLDDNNVVINQDEHFFLTIYSKAITLLALYDNEYLSEIEVYKICKLKITDQQKKIID